jgi:hypothetical protein
MELIGEFDRDVMNKIKNNNLQYTAHYFKHSDSKLNNNLIDMMCTMSFDDNQLYSQKYLSPDNLRMIRTSLALNTINNTKDIDSQLNKLTIGCNHIFHDSKWLRFSKDNFICSLNDNVNFVYCNSFNSEDMDDRNLIQFIQKLQDLNINVKFVKFDENEEDMEEEYENSSVIWLVIMIEKNEI